MLLKCLWCFLPLLVNKTAGPLPPRQSNPPFSGTELWSHSAYIHPYQIIVSYKLQWHQRIPLHLDLTCALWDWIAIRGTEIRLWYDGSNHLRRWSRMHYDHIEHKCKCKCVLQKAIKSPYNSIASRMAAIFFFLWENRVWERRTISWTDQSDLSQILKWRQMLITDVNVGSIKSYQDIIWIRNIF